MPPCGTCHTLPHFPSSPDDSTPSVSCVQCVVAVSTLDEEQQESRGHHCPVFGAEGAMWPMWPMWPRYSSSLRTHGWIQHYTDLPTRCSHWCSSGMQVTGNTCSDCTCGWLAPWEGIHACIWLVLQTQPEGLWGGRMPLQLSC